MSEASDLKKAYTALANKQGDVLQFWKYYRGEQRLKWTSDKLRRLFKEKTGFVENWCAVVVDSSRDRLILEGIQVQDDEAASKDMAASFTESGLDAESEKIVLESIVVGESFLVVGKDDAGELEAYHNPAKNVQAFYREDKPRKMSMAAKWWLDEEAHRHIVLYYPDRIVEYKNKQAETRFLVTRNEDTTKKKTTLGFSEKQWVIEEEGANEWGQIPVFHFRVDSQGFSDLQNAIPLQDVVNKMLSDMMVTGEFAAFPQRYVVTNADLKDTKINAGTTLEIPGSDGEGEDTQVGVFPAADLTNFIVGLDHASQAIASITRTPKHYFQSTGGDPSGEALLAMEAPLNKKCERYQKSLSRTWIEASAFVLTVQTKDIDKGKLTPTWGDIPTVQPKSKADTIKTLTEAGMPLTTILKRDGWTEEQITDMLSDSEVQATASEPAEFIGQTEGLSLTLNDAIVALADELTDPVVAAIAALVPANNSPIGGGSET